jgi:DNA-binding CsgD family transcriptional regulator
MTSTNRISESTQVAQAFGSCETPAPLNASEEQVFNLLASGLNAAMVASTLSLSESYISQLLSNSEFRDRVTAARLAKNKGLVERDDKLELTESKALERLAQLLPMVTKPLEAAKIYQTLNSAKRTTSIPANSSNAGGATVVLNLPKNSSVQFTLAHDTNQVLEVDGRSMAPLPASRVKELMTEKSMVRIAQSKLAQIAVAHTKEEDIG